MDKFFDQKLGKDRDKTKTEVAPKFKLGQSHVPKPLDRNKLPPLKAVTEHGRIGSSINGWRCEFNFKSLSI